MPVVNDFPITRFFKTTLSLFFKGKKDLTGENVRFFKALELKREETKKILKVIAQDYKAEDVLVLKWKNFLNKNRENAAGENRRCSLFGEESEYEKIPCIAFGSFYGVVVGLSQSKRRRRRRQ
jgi:hypothetical protein